MSDRMAVYTVRERGEGKKPFWARIGTCFTNRDGSLSIVLDALPIDGRLVVREEQQREDREAPPARRPPRAAPSPRDEDDYGKDEVPF